MSTFRSKKIQQLPLKPLLAAFGIGALGVVFLAASQAATPVASKEAEAGSVASPAIAAADSSASGGSAVKFAAAPPPVAGELTAQKLTAVKSKRILFGHQSVGGNMVSGISSLYSSYGVSPIQQIGTGQINSVSGGFFADFYVGENYDPLGKIADFNTTVRQYSSRLDIAFFKLCYVDINGSTNVQAIFNSYKTTMDQLVSDFPNIKFVFSTGALDWWDPSAALKREQLNNLIRQEYGSTGRLFDLAKIESTRPDGTRVSGTQSGQTYYQIWDDYSDDGGHLNSTGIRLVDTALFNLLAGL